MKAVALRTVPMLCTTVCDRNERPLFSCGHTTAARPTAGAVAALACTCVIVSLNFAENPRVDGARSIAFTLRSKPILTIQPGLNRSVVDDDAENGVVDREPPLYLMSATGVFN